MLMRWVLVAFVVSLGCGESQKGPSVGNRPVDEPDADSGNNISIFPDVRIDNNGRPDLGTPPQDTGPDLSNPDTGPDLAVEPDLGADMGVDMAMQMNCPRSGVALGAPCGCNQECTSGVCADASLTEDGFCTTSCTSRNDCAAAQACVTDRFGTSVCRPDDTGTNCTAGGQPTPDVCSSGHCVQAGSNFALDYFCSVPCTVSSDCTMGHACTPVRCQFNPAEGYRCLPTIIAQRSADPTQVLLTFPESSKLCVKVGDPNPCLAQTMASDEQACPGSMCDASPTGRCTSACVATADCPAGGCVDYDLSNPSLPIRVCDL